MKKEDSGIEENNEAKNFFKIGFIMFIILFIVIAVSTYY